MQAVSKQSIINEYKRSEGDTGSPEVQVALLTHRIKYLTEHFKVHKQDLHSKRGLHALVNLRKRLLKYLKASDLGRYRDLIKRLGLRDSY